MNEWIFNNHGCVIEHQLLSKNDRPYRVIICNNQAFLLDKEMRNISQIVIFSCKKKIDSAYKLIIVLRKVDNN